MPTLLHSMPSNPTDPRFRAPRSPDCPNDITREEVARQSNGGTTIPQAGLCGLCAWGFHTMESSEHQPGESVEGLALTPLLSEGGHAGYKAQCGRVKLYMDNQGRVGAVRTVGGEERFFPGIEGNWAFERYRRAHPELIGAAAA